MNPKSKNCARCVSALARAEGSVARLLARLAKADVLALDDWGLGALREAQRHDIHGGSSADRPRRRRSFREQQVNGRHRNGPSRGRKSRAPHPQRVMSAPPIRALVHKISRAD